MAADIAQVTIGSLAAIAALMLLTWLLSLARKDASIVDIIWGFGFVVVAWTAFALGDGDLARKTVVAVLVSVWGLRLSLHLFRRNWGKGEDFRYRYMRKNNAEHFGRWSLVNVFGLQGVLMFGVSLPVQMAQVRGGSDGLTPIVFVAIAVWAVGFAFEAVGDWQLRRFKADSANQGRVMDRGLWRYTRHPNYFGDAVVWWGIFLLAAARPEMLWTVIGPLIMTFLLTRVSGVPMLERSMARRKPGYEEYMRRTSAFFPLPPKPAAAAGSLDPGQG